MYLKPSFDNFDFKSTLLKMYPNFVGSLENFGITDFKGPFFISDQSCTFA